MKAHITIDVRDTTKMGHEPRTRRVKQYFDRVRNAVGKYVTIDKDGIFKDPDWPHLWDHKR